MTHADPHITGEALLDSLQGNTVERAVALARHLMTRAAALLTRAEKRQQAELERMLQSPTDRATLTQMTFRAKTPRRVADQLTPVLDVQGVHGYGITTANKYLNENGQRRSFSRQNVVSICTMGSAAAWQCRVL